MELFVVGILCLVAYGMLRGIAGLFSLFADKRYRGYKHLAAVYRGKYERRGMSDPPTVSFPYKGATIRVGLAPQLPGQPNVPRSRVVCRFAQGLPFRMELAPVIRPAPPQAPKGTRVVKLGVPAFDREFVVQANDPDMAQVFLGPQARNSLDYLKKMSPPGGMLISVNPERLLVQVDRNLGSNPEAISAMVHFALELLEELVVGVQSRLSAGVTIVEAHDDAPGEPAQTPICKVCGEAIVGKKVLCNICKTPHHIDCWDYIGSCSIFGCVGKTSSRG